MDARIDENNWIRCGCCGHKLARIVDMGSDEPSLILEIKCHSCKGIQLCDISKMIRKKADEAAEYMLKKNDSE
ncbi:hypothetical protein SAMN02910292_02552 [Lachnospiraceae bacterium XBB2008]|nr:hypothetical protein SAMN02910292_02552 [Lachnospiraceae bacterium XBB2008]